MTSQSNTSPEEIEAVRAATMQFYDALGAMFAGDPEPLKDLYSHADDVTYLPGEGGLLVGWDAVVMTLFPLVALALCLIAWLALTSRGESAAV